MAAWWENVKNCLIILENLSIKTRLSVRLKKDAYRLSNFHHASLSTQSQGNRNSWFSIGQVGHVENEIIEFFALKMHLDRKQDRTYGFWKYSEEQLKNYTEELKTKLNKTNLNVV